MTRERHLRRHRFLFRLAALAAAALGTVDDYRISEDARVVRNVRAREEPILVEREFDLFEQAADARAPLAVVEHMQRVFGPVVEEAGDRLAARILGAAVEHLPRQFARRDDALFRQAVVKLGEVESVLAELSEHLLDGAVEAHVLMQRVPVARRYRMRVLTE